MAIELLHCEKEFTPLASSTTITIKATAYEVGGNAPCEIIRSDQDWYVDVEWSITGDLIRHFCGQWVLSVALDSVGPGLDYQFPDPPVRIEMKPCGDGTYTHRIDVPAGAVDARDSDGTIYDMAVTLGSLDACDKPSHIFAHCSGGHIHVVPGPVH